jgi:hypothetical protein
MFFPLFDEEGDWFFDSNPDFLFIPPGSLQLIGFIQFIIPGDDRLIAIVLISKIKQLFGFQKTFLELSFIDLKR